MWCTCVRKYVCAGGSSVVCMQSVDLCVCASCSCEAGGGACVCGLFSCRRVCVEVISVYQDEVFGCTYVRVCKWVCKLFP